MPVNETISAFYKSMWAEILGHSTADLAAAFLLSMFILVHLVVALLLLYSVLRWSFKLLLWTGPVLILIAVIYFGGTALFPEQVDRLFKLVH